jgi:uroporphyrinogen-III synthase
VSALPPVVWVVAAADTAARWTRVLRREGFAAGALAWSEVRPVRDVPARLPPADLVLLTSRHAVEALPAGAARGRAAACVGEATARAAGEAGFDVVLVGTAGGAELARRTLAGRPGLEGVLFLVGAHARAEAQEILEGAGVRVERRVVYETAPRAAFPAEVAGAPEPEGIVAGSPRAVEALAAALRGAARRLPARLAVAVPGSVTAERAAALLERYVARAERAEARALADALRAARAGGDVDGSAR